MTEMSEPHCPRCDLIARNSSKLRAGFFLARGVHEKPSLVTAPLLALFLLLTGCIIPPSLSTGNEDAGVNSPPTITAVRTDAEDLFEPGPILLTRGEGTISFELLDTDVKDTLVVRVFIGYRFDDPVSARSECMAPPTGEAE